MQTRWHCAEHFKGLLEKSSKMWFLTIVLFCQAVFSNTLRDTPRSIQGSLTVNTTSGIFAPYLPSSNPGIASFPDIPYALNPTGPLRFAPPVPATPPSDGHVQYATDLPAGCFQYVPSIQLDTVGFMAEKAEIFQRGDYTNTTEDCLRLSIFAPSSVIDRAASKEDSAHRRHQDLLPVVVWVHGGGWMSGGINVPYQSPSKWVQRSQGHIVVQVQYRLNLLGLPNAAGLAALDENVNFAFLDQRLAIEWVRDNIAAFGGDPARITLWGESAGAYSTDGYLFAWAADPIVAGVIADSGNALALEPYSTSAANYSQFSHVAAQVGCAGLAPATELACMRAVPASTLQAYIQGAAAVDAGLTFPSIIDNLTVFPDYASRIAAGADQFPTRVPLLIGTNVDEGGAVVPYDFNGSATALSLPAALMPAAQAFKLGLQCTTIREVRLRSAVGAPTWQYLYAGNFSDISPRPWLGAYHTAELPMVFGTFGTEGPSTGFEQRVSEHMQDMYLAFAEDPAEGLIKAGWIGAVQSPQVPYLMKWADDGEVAQLVDVEGIRQECIENGYQV
jgi:acetylcholinesterase